MLKLYIVQLYFFINNSKLKDELNSIKIATLNKEAYKMIVSNNIDFFKKNADNFFNSFNFRLLSPNDDFFNLASYSSVFGLGLRHSISRVLSWAIIYLCEHLHTR